MKGIAGNQKLARVCGVCQVQLAKYKITRSPYNNSALPLALILLFLSFAAPVAAQQSDVYSLEWRYEAPIIGVGGATNIGGFLLNFYKDPLTEQQINQLDEQDVWQLERPATDNYSEKYALASDITVAASMAAPFSLSADPAIRQNWKTLTLLYAESLLLTNGLTTLTKHLVKRKRPYTYNPEAPLHIKLEKDATASFFSGHTSLSATGTFFAAKVYSDYHPDSPAKPYVWIAAATLPAVTGFLRYEAGEHFPTDIVVGYVVGASVGILIPEIHKVVSKE